MNETTGSRVLVLWRRHHGGAPSPSGALSRGGPPVREAGPVREELVEGRGPTPELGKYERQDLEQLAKDTGEDFDVLVERHRGQAAVTRVTGRYEFRYKEIYVSAGVGPVDGRGHQWLVFTERPPEKVFRDLATLGTDTVVMYGAAGTHRELRRLSFAVMKSLTDHKGVFSYAITGTDRYGAFVTVSYSLDPAASPAPTREDIERWKAEALAAGAARFDDGRMPVPVRFIELEPGLGVELE